jgi:hypothetical protein
MDGSSRLYTAAGSLANKTLVLLSLMLILVLPIAAYAESFTVTTNKDIYAADEKAIIVGTIPDDAPPGYAVLIKVTGPRGDCNTQNVLPAADNSFASRPVKLNECGFGEFIVSAFYADQKTDSTFTISNSSHKDAASKLELRILKNVLLQAQDALNAKVKGLIEAGYVLPEDVAGTYRVGVSEASLALQAIDFGDAAEAKRHMIFAIRDFRQVFSALSDENVASLDLTTEQAASDGDSGIVGKYRMLREYYYRLEVLADKNHVEKESQFKAAALLLTSAKDMIDKGNLDGAERNLLRVNGLLEEIRASLFDGEERVASDTNETSSVDKELARKLTSAADRFERTALGLLNETNSIAEAHAKVQVALALIANARSSIEASDLESARDSLYSAYKAISEAQSLIGNEDGDTSSSGDNNEKSHDSGESEDEDSGNSDSDKDNRDKGTKGNDDSEDDQ